METYCMISENDSKERCINIKEIFLTYYKEVKALPMIELFLEKKENEELFLEVIRNGNQELLPVLDKKFQRFLRIREAFNYCVGICKIFSRDFDKKEKLRNGRFFLTLDKPIKPVDDSSTPSFVDLISDPDQEQVFAESICDNPVFEMENDKLAQIISKLKPIQKKILSLRYKEELTQREVAKVLGESDQHIYYWHQKALEQIRQGLNSN